MKGEGRGVAGERGEVNRDGSKKKKNGSLSDGDTDCKEGKRMREQGGKRGKRKRQRKAQRGCRGGNNEMELGGERSAE